MTAVEGQAGGGETWSNPAERERGEGEVGQADRENAMTPTITNLLSADPNVDPAFVAALPGPMTRDQLYQQAQVIVFHYRNSPKLAEKIVELAQGAVRESRR